MKKSTPYVNGSDGAALDKLIASWSKDMPAHDARLKRNATRVRREINAGYKKHCSDNPRFKQIG